MIDLRGTPTHQCVCGSTTFKILAGFDSGEIAWYSLEGYCYDCGAHVTVPCPLDQEKETINGKD